MIVVSDTSPITALLKIDRAGLLAQLFARVVIPPAVMSELRREHRELPEWLEIEVPAKIPAIVADAGLDAGETQALALALEMKADAVLMDERLGRRVAHSLGLLPMGVLGCLVLAKREGLLAAVGPIIADLELRSGCWFHPALTAAVLAAAGE